VTPEAGAWIGPLASGDAEEPRQKRCPVKGRGVETLAKEVKAVGISVVRDDASGLQFKCKSCRKAWSIKWDESEEVVRGWWRCPGGCSFCSAFSFMARSASTRCSRAA